MSQETASQINQLVLRFAALQRSLGLSDGAFGARYRKFLNSVTSWQRLKQNKWQGILNEENCLRRLLEFAKHIEASAAFDAEEYIGTLPFIAELNAHFERLQGSTRDRRCLACLAPEGMGKSWWISSMVAAEPGKRVHVQISDMWRNKPLHLLCGIADKLSVPREKNPAHMMAALISALCALPEMVVFLDEGHNGGAALFPILKELIDKTPGRWGYFAFPTQFDLVRGSSGGALAESRQFLRRCIKPVFDDWRFGVTPEDVAAFLAARGFRRSGELDKVADQLAPVLASNFNFTTLADALDEAAMDADGGQPSLAQVVEQVGALCSTARDRRAAKEKAKLARQQGIKGQ